MNIDKNATAELVGALVRGFLFGDEHAIVRDQAEQQSEPSEQPIVPPSPHSNIHQPPKGIHIVANTYQTIDHLKPGLLSEGPRLDTIQRAFDCFNAVGLSLTDTALMLAAIRATMVRCNDVPPEVVDYTADVALEVVDTMVAEPPKTG